MNHCEPLDQDSQGQFWKNFFKLKIYDKSPHEKDQIIAKN